MTREVWRHDGIEWKRVPEGSLYAAVLTEHTEKARRSGSVPPAEQPRIVERPELVGAR